MKKFLNMMIVAMTLLIVFSTVQAKTFKTRVFVEADNYGTVTIKEGGDDIVKLIQYCPDEWKDDCGDNIIVSRTGNSFVLDMDGLTQHQSAFNFLNTSNEWLRIPNEIDVHTGKNIGIIPSTNDAYFIYKGIIPQR